MGGGGGLGEEGLGFDLRGQPLHHDYQKRMSRFPFLRRGETVRVPIRVIDNR